MAEPTRLKRLARPGVASAPGTRGRRGFSLVELLVAIAIIMVLAALLVGAVGTASELGGLTACRSNLHDLGIALLAYAKDHGGALPVTETLDGPQPELTAGLAKGGYMAEPRTYYCPAERVPERRFSQENFDEGRIGYFYFSCEKASPNRLLSTFLRWNVTWPRRLQTAMPSGTWAASDCWFSGGPTAHRSFKKGVNYLTLGGSVGMVEESPRESFR
jgi:prepilin-type N-terminal cleavage/methylation domain-containing protein